MAEKNEVNAEELFQRAVEAYADAEKHEEAFQLLNKAAEEGHIQAYKMLGTLYMSGQYAPWPEKNEAKAAMWYQRAADSGNAEAMYWLGQCYRLGIGIEQDTIRATHWEKQAMERGLVLEEEEPASDLPAKPGAAWYEDRQDEVKKEERRYRLGRALLSALLGVLLGWVVITPFYLIWGRNLAGNQATLFWSISGGFVILLIVLFFLLGLRSARRKIAKKVAYRETPFYHAFGCELDQMTADQKWSYRLYKALKQDYVPISWRAEKWPEEEGCGYLIPHWIFEVEGEKAQPELMLVSRKAIYVIKALQLTGRVQGDLRDAMWSLYSDGEKDLTAERIPNLVDQNAKNISIIKRELGQRCKASLDEIPFYNIICINDAVDIKGLRRVSAPEDTFFVQGSPEKLRRNIWQWDEKMIPHNVNMDTIRAAFKEIGAAFRERSGW